MSMDELATYLTLTPEFGGTRFGPFETIEVRLGSDPDTCHIVLQAELGVEADHVKLLRQGPNNLILAPSARTSTVYLWKKGATQSTQLTTPTAVTPGDGFSLVTPEGPRFIIELDELPEEIKAQRAKSRPKTGRGRLSKEAFAGEGKRQIWTRLLVLGPAQLVQRAWIYVKSGAIFIPRNMIMMAMIASGWVFGGVSMCGKKKLQADLQVTNERVENCEQEVTFAKDLSGVGPDARFEELAAMIVQSPKLVDPLGSDDGLRAEVKKRAKVLVENQRMYNWLINGKARKARAFSQWRKKLMKMERIDLDSRLLLVWLGIDNDRNQKEFDERNDSEDTPVCGRGPLKMTYRQAVSLGLAAQADAFVPRNYERLTDLPKEREELLQATILAAGGDGFPEDQTIKSNVGPVQQGLSGCVYVEGDDDRKLVTNIFPMMRREFGKKAKGVPNESNLNASVSRVAKYWASDLTRVDYTLPEPGIDFSSAQISTVLDPLANRGQWVMKQTAETIAKALVLPCF